MRRLLLLLSLLPLALSAQTPVNRKAQTRAIVRDSACVGEPAGWRWRGDTTFRTMTEATTRARTKIACPVIVPPPVDTPPTPPPVYVPPNPANTVDTIVNVVKMDPRQPDVWIVPRGDVGSATVDTFTAQGVGPYNDGRLIRSSPDTLWKAQTDWEGDVRTGCTFIRYALFDPIVYPGQNNVGHLHAFYGNSGITPSFNPSPNAPTPSTCAGGAANASGYWVPALFDQTTKQVITAEELGLYYKTSGNTGYLRHSPIPHGFRMIAGNALAGAAQPHVTWYCTATGARDGADGRPPACPVGAVLQFGVTFPTCWNGRDLDSPDHKSHMAYLERHSTPDSGTVAKCPPTHPVLFTEISELLQYRVRPGDNPQNWCFSNNMPGQACGTGGHADWWGAWNEGIMQRFTDKCHNARKDCGSLDVGDHLRLIPPRSKFRP
jgi:hypothetical protein